MILHQPWATLWIKVFLSKLLRGVTYYLSDQQDHSHPAVITVVVFKYLLIPDLRI